MERYRSHLVWEAWTDIGSVGVGRIAVLTQIDNFRQGLSHPRLDPTTIPLEIPRVKYGAARLARWFWASHTVAAGRSTTHRPGVA